MTPGIVIPLLLVPVVLAVGFGWYRRKMASLRSDDAPRAVAGTRLTSETLRRLPSPPWRVVIEIAPEALDGIDHVVIGTCGVVAVTTVVADRSAEVIERDPMLMVDPAIGRAAVSSLTDAAGIRCEVSAKVFWGTPDTRLPPGRQDGHGHFEVEGQRLLDWLQSLPTDRLDAGRIDTAWRAVLTGIGRPDPFP